MTDRLIIPRAIAHSLHAAANEYPVVTIFGPRQSGKTTLARMEFPHLAYRSLESPDIRYAAMLDPRGFLADVKEGAILDEIQRTPELLSYIQEIVDDPTRSAQFILTGSHQPLLHQAVGQSLAGRTAVLTLLPFTFEEIKHIKALQSPLELNKHDIFKLIIQGQYPRLIAHRLDPERFYNAYVATYLERDMRMLVNIRDLNRFQQFLILVAGRVGQVVNYTSLGNDIGVSSATIKQWISVLKASFILFELAPYFENVGKRVIKSPKIYFTDTGLAAFLLGLRTAEQVRRDPLRGCLYENLIVLEVLKARLNKGFRPELYYYRDTHGNEVDLIIREGRRLTPVEIKSAETFNHEFLKGIRNFKAIIDTGRVCRPAVVYNGNERFSVEGVSVFNPFLHDDLQLVMTESSNNLH